MYSTHRDSCHAESHHHRSLVNRATISWHYVLLMLCSTANDCSLPVRCDRIVAGRRQLSGPVGRLDGTRRRWSGSFVAGNWTTLRATHAAWLINHVAAAPSTSKGGSPPRSAGFSRSPDQAYRKVFLSVFIMRRDLQRSPSLDTPPNDVSGNIYDTATFCYAALHNAFRQFFCLSFRLSSRFCLTGDRTAVVG